MAGADASASAAAGARAGSRGRRGRSGRDRAHLIDPWAHRAQRSTTPARAVGTAWRCGRTGAARGAAWVAGEGSTCAGEAGTSRAQRGAAAFGSARWRLWRRGPAGRTTGVVPLATGGESAARRPGAIGPTALPRLPVRRRTRASRPGAERGARRSDPLAGHVHAATIDRQLRRGHLDFRRDRTRGPSVRTAVGRQAVSTPVVGPGRAGVGSGSPAGPVERGRRCRTGRRGRSGARPDGGQARGRRPIARTGRGAQPVDRWRAGGGNIGSRRVTPSRAGVA